MTATATTNGRPQRKQLSDQLDRLDEIIEALSVRLTETVADATREGTRLAVRDVILELMTNADLRAMIPGMAVAPPAAPPAAPAFERPEPAAPRAGIWRRVKARFAAAKAAAAERCTAAATTVTATARTLAAVMPLRTILLVGAGVGLLVGVVSYVCPHGLSAVLSAVGGAVTAVAAQVGHWVRRNAPGLVGTS